MYYQVKYGEHKNIYIKKKQLKETHVIHLFMHIFYFKLERKCN